MIEKIIEVCARNKFLVALLSLVAVAGAVYSMKNIPLDAIPDLSDTQVIVYSRWDRSPDIIEDQVTYPIITAMLGAPKIKAIRGFSDFGYSYVYIIFQDGTDLYWARSRVLEYLSKIQARLPEGVRTELGPDATGVGWVYQYALVDKTGAHNLAELRSFQDWTLRYWLQSVPGVAEVASIGGFQKQYQVMIDPNALVAYNVPLSKVVDAIRDGNNDVGGRLVEFSGAEYMVRGRGYAKSIPDIENIVVGNGKAGTPILREEPRAGDSGAGHPPRRLRPGRPGRHRGRHHRHAPGRKRAERHQPRERKDPGNHAVSPAGRRDRHRSMTVPISSSGPSTRSRTNWSRK